MRPGATIATWKELHTRALTHDGSDDSAWLLRDFTPRIPRIQCTCLGDWMRWLTVHPPRWSNYFAWTVEAHNAVNLRLNRPCISLSEALQRWSKPA